MKFKLRIACAALLAGTVAPAWALQLGQIQVKSALNQPLVAAIPLHPKNLTELDGLTVGMAPVEDFTRAGLQVTPADRTLQFRVVTDNNGQKLILVTSSQPITDPYLDFLVQVNTRQGRQLQEFVVLLNPVIAAPAPEVEAASVGRAQAQQPETLPPSSAFPQPAPPPAPQPPVQPVAKAVAPAPPPPPEPAPPPPAPQPAAQPVAKAVTPAPPPAAKPVAKSVAPAPKPVAKSVAPAPHARAAAPATGETIPVAHGDTLYGIASQRTEGTPVTINQMMLALKASNPEAFFRDNINDLKAGAILRIPTRDEIDQTSVAKANAEVHRQYEAWRAARPHRATVVEGTAAAAAANAAPRPGKAGPVSDHLMLVPPTGKGGGTNNHPGVAGGTGTETVAGLRQQLQNDRGSLVSLDQSNADLESRVHSLKDIADNSGKLLSLKDATIAELQRKLAAMHSGETGAAHAAVAKAHAAANPAAASVTPGVATSSRQAGATAGTEPAAAPPTGTPWYKVPLTWIVAGLVVLALILLGLLRRKRGWATAPVAGNGPLPDLEDSTRPRADVSDEEASLRAKLVENPEDLAAYLGLCRLYYTARDEQRFFDTARVMRTRVADPDCAEWREVAVMGAVLAPHDALFETPPEPRDDPYEVAALHWRVDEGATKARAVAPREPGPVRYGQRAAVIEEPPAPALVEPEAVPLATVATIADAEPEFSDDPVDTKLDLARAYLDMGDPVGARAMLEEVLEEGSQTQKDQATRLLADLAS